MNNNSGQEGSPEGSSPHLTDGQSVFGENDEVEQVKQARVYLEGLPRSERLNVVANVKEDCSQLLQLFSAKNSMRFQDFAACWREMFFSHMLSGRINKWELLDYLEELLAIIMSLLVSSSDLVRKVGCLYMLYGIYMKIPQEFKSDIFIRVTPASWTELLKLRQHAKEGNHHDAHFVFSMLFHTGSFLFVAYERQKAPDLRSSLDRFGELPTAADDGNYESPLMEYLMEGGLQQLSTLHTKYQSIKRQVFKGDRELKALTDDVAPKLSVRLKRAAEGLPVPRELPAGDQRPGEATTSSVLSQREEARARAFSRFREPAPLAFIPAVPLGVDAEPAEGPSRRGRGANPAARSRGRGRRRLSPKVQSAAAAPTAGAVGGEGEGGAPLRSQGRRGKAKRGRGKKPY